MGPVQSKGSVATDGTGLAWTAAFPSNVTPGNRVVVSGVVAESTGTGTGGQLIVTSSGSAVLGTWRPVVQSPNLNANPFSVLHAIWTAPVIKGGSLTVAISGGNSANRWINAGTIAEYAALIPADDLSCVDVSAAGTWGTASPTATSPATTAPNELVIGGYADTGGNAAVSAGAGFGDLV